MGIEPAKKGNETPQAANIPLLWMWVVLSSLLCLAPYLLWKLESQPLLHSKGTTLSVLRVLGIIVFAGCLTTGIRWALGSQRSKTMLWHLILGSTCLMLLSFGWDWVVLLLPPNQQPDAAQIASFRKLYLYDGFVALFVALCCFTLTWFSAWKTLLSVPIRQWIIPLLSGSLFVSGALYYYYSIPSYQRTFHYLPVLGSATLCTLFVYAWTARRSVKAADQDISLPFARWLPWVTAAGALLAVGYLDVWRYYIDRIAPYSQSNNLFFLYRPSNYYRLLVIFVFFLIWGALLCLWLHQQELISGVHALETAPNEENNQLALRFTAISINLLFVVFCIFVWIQEPILFSYLWRGGKGIFLHTTRVTGALLLIGCLWGGTQWLLGWRPKRQTFLFLLFVFAFFLLVSFGWDWCLSGYYEHVLLQSATPDKKSQLAAKYLSVLNRHSRLAALFSMLCCVFLTWCAAWKVFFSASRRRWLAPFGVGGLVVFTGYYLASYLLSPLLFTPRYLYLVGGVIFFPLLLCAWTSWLDSRRITEKYNPISLYSVFLAFALGGMGIGAAGYLDIWFFYFKHVSAISDLSIMEKQSGALLLQHIPGFYALLMTAATLLLCWLGLALLLSVSFLRHQRLAILDRLPELSMLGGLWCLLIFFVVVSDHNDARNFVNNFINEAEFAISRIHQRYRIILPRISTNSSFYMFNRPRMRDVQVWLHLKQDGSVLMQTGKALPQTMTSANLESMLRKERRRCQEKKRQDSLISCRSMNIIALASSTTSVRRLLPEIKRAQRLRSPVRVCWVTYRSHHLRSSQKVLYPRILNGIWSNAYQPQYRCIYTTLRDSSTKSQVVRSSGRFGLSLHLLPGGIRLNSARSGSVLSGCLPLQFSKALPHKHLTCKGGRLPQIKSCLLRCLTQIKKVTKKLLNDHHSISVVLSPSVADQWRVVHLLTLFRLLQYREEDFFQLVQLEVK